MYFCCFTKKEKIKVEKKNICTNIVQNRITWHTARNIYLYKIYCSEDLFIFSHFKLFPKFEIIRSGIVIPFSVKLYPSKI